MKFRDEFWFLSNMYPCEIALKLNGELYKFTCAEAAFQACKNFSHAKDFVGIDGFAAKSLGKKVPLRSDWENVKVTCAEIVVREKFRQNPELMHMLKAVRGHIAEDNTWGDTFWGFCNGRGENHLGRILMNLREA